MLTNKDLLTHKIQVRHSENRNDMTLPNGLDNIKTTHKIHKGLFSIPLFRESFRSNRLGLAVVSGGNALIMIIIIAILSTLHINSTSAALKELFNNADTENTVKSGAISLYTSYSETANAYQTFINADDQVVTMVNGAVDAVGDPNLDSAFARAKSAYNIAYALPGGTDASAKSVAMAAVTATINASSDYSESQKTVVLKIFDYSFDEYAKNKSATNQSIFIKTVPMAVGDVAKDTMSLSDENTQTIKSSLSSAINRVYNEAEKKGYVETETSFDLVRALADGDTKEYAEKMIDKLEGAYKADRDAYIASTAVRDATVSDTCIDIVIDTLGEFAYYQYLPDFTVQYKTNELGYPVRFVTNYDDDGNPYQKMVPVTTYQPEFYTPVAEKMGVKANILQKMHKDLLTGSSYTDEDIRKAKDEAKDSIEMISNHLSEFMVDYRARVNNVNDYYNGTAINDEAIVTKVENEVSDIAGQSLIDYYNEKNKANITSIDEITLENNAMSGEEMISLVKGYASGGISAYKLYYKEGQQKGYSSQDTMFLALTKGSEGVIAQLPVAVNDSLVEMGDMNVYGIIIGMVAFGIATLLIPMVYTILLSKSLVSEKVETGSLAFTLSTPITRRSFIATEAIYLLFSEVVMGLTLLAATLITRRIGIWAGSQDLTDSLPDSDILYYALGNFMVTLAISGINFLASCHFNKTNKAIGAGGGLTIYFFICSILGLFGTKAIPGTIRISAMNLFNFITIDSLFDSMAVMQGRMVAYWLKLAVLLVIAAATYILGAINFEKKDLPL